MPALMSSLAPNATAIKQDPKNPKRPPPPSLFLGPPSRNASNISLTSLHPVVTTQSATGPSTQPRAPLLRTRSNLVTETTGANSNPNITAPLGRSSQQRNQQLQQKSEGDRTDALWAEMQATLAEVELSAVSGTHVFGAKHSKALEELRTAQISLAQAWARNEADDVIEHPPEAEVESVKGKGVLGAKTEGEGGGSGGRRESKLEEETEGDILLARKRREANDRYFKRVNDGVLDVVGRLEDVAAAMGKVEKESREIWSEDSSMDTGSGIS